MTLEKNQNNSQVLMVYNIEHSSRCLLDFVALSVCWIDDRKFWANSNELPIAATDENPRFLFMKTFRVLAENSGLN